MTGADGNRALTALRRFARGDRQPARCELCAAPLPDPHAHLFAIEARELICTCAACSVLFPATGQQARRRVERRVVPLRDLQLNDEDWRALDVPVRLLFLCPSALHDCVYAVYPNAQGAVQAQLPLRAWHELLGAHPVLASVGYELEALVVDGREGRCACSCVSIDVCHGLVGLLRSSQRSAVSAWPELERALSDLQRGAYA